MARRSSGPRAARGQTELAAWYDASHGASGPEQLRGAAGQALGQLITNAKRLLDSGHGHRHHPRPASAVAALKLLAGWGVVTETDRTLAGWGERSGEEALLSINLALLIHLLPSPLHQYETAEETWLRRARNRHDGG